MKSRNKVVANAMKAINKKAAVVDTGDGVELVDDATGETIKAWKGYSNRNVDAAFAYGKKMGYVVNPVVQA